MTTGTTTTMTPAKSGILHRSPSNMKLRSAEIARLSSLFEKLATGRSSIATASATSPSTCSTEDNKPAAPRLPLTIHDAIKSVTEVESITTLRHEDLLFQSSVPPNNLNRQSETDDDEKNTHAKSRCSDESTKDFSVGEKYPFTFKLMIHKLYEADQWASKVKDALENSRRQFKPLAEQELPSSPSKAKHGTKDTFPIAHAPARSVLRSLSAGPGKEAGVPTKHIKENHAAKKRCVGRRKSIGNPDKQGLNAWFYDAEVSFVDPVNPSHGPAKTLLKPIFVRGNPKETVENRRRALSAAAATPASSDERKLGKRPFVT